MKLHLVQKFSTRITHETNAKMMKNPEDRIMIMIITYLYGWVTQSVCPTLNIFHFEYMVEGNLI